MWSLDLNLSKRYETFSVKVSCPQDECSFEGKTLYVSSCDLCVEVPTTQIKVTLLKFLNHDVTVRIGNVTIAGIMSGYTIERDRYLIGIIVSKQDRAAWKKFLADKPKVSFLTEIRHVSPL